MCTDPATWVAIGKAVTGTKMAIGTASTLAGVTSALSIAVPAVSAIAGMKQQQQQQEYQYADTQNLNTIKTNIAGDSLSKTYAQNTRKYVQTIEDASTKKQSIEYGTRRDIATTRAKLGEANIAGKSAKRLMSQPRQQQAFTNFQIDVDLDRSRQDLDYAQDLAGYGYQTDVLGLPRPYEPSSTAYGLGVAGEVVEAGYKGYERYKKHT